MGCCKSCLYYSSTTLIPWNSNHFFSSFTQAEMIQLGSLLSEMPDHCHEAITNLPIRQLLNLYQYHLMAYHYGLQKEWLFTISYEQRVIKGLQTLMPNEKDHYIFFKFHSVLSAAFLAIGEISTAIEGIQTVLHILLKHTPNDHLTISSHYYYLANAHRVMKNWAISAQYFKKAVETARLSDETDQAYVNMLETEFQEVK